MGYESDQTVGDMGERDRDNFTHLLEKHMYQKAFRGKEAVPNAMKYMAHCMLNLQLSGGLVITPGMNAAEIESAMDTAKVITESREYDDDDETYISGVYIYRYGKDKFSGREIIGFVSKPIFKESRLVTHDGEKGAIIIKTTWKD